MNTLFISPNSPYESIGGVERYVSNLIEFCKSQTQHHTVIVLPTYGENITEETGGLFIYLDKNLSIPLNMSNRDILEKSRFFSKTIENIIVKHKIDVICAENFHVGLPPAYGLQLNMVAGLYKKPLVLRLHSFASSELQKDLINQLMWDKVSCVSKSVAGDCFQKGADINLISTDYLGVNTNVFNTNINTADQFREKLNLLPEDKIVLTATRIIQGRKNILKEKGLINLIQAFSKLSPRNPSFHLLISVGKPPDILKADFDLAKEMLLGFIRLNHIEEKTIVKMFKLGEMPAAYKNSDVFALPSENETFGQVFIEAMACGLPVIGTKVGGIPEIINDSYNGCLVPPNDSSILAQMIEKLINDHSIRDRYTAEGIKTVHEKFTFKKQMLKFTQTLEKVTPEKI